jgi:hypothetical protein
MTGKNIAETLLPNINKASMRLAFEFWPPSPKADEDRSAYSDSIRERMKDGQVERYARLASHFARAVQIAANHNVDIKIPDMSREVFEEALEQQCEAIGDLVQGIGGVLPAERTEECMKSFRDQSELLETAQMDMVEAVYAYRAGKERRSQYGNNAIRMNPR